MSIVGAIGGVVFVVLLVQWGITRWAVEYTLNNDNGWKTEVVEWIRYSAAVAAGVCLTVTYPTVVTFRTVDKMVLSPQSIYEPMYLFVGGVLALLSVVVVERHAMSNVMSKKFRAMMMRYVTDTDNDEDADDDDDPAADSAADTQIREIPKE